MAEKIRIKVGGMEYSIISDDDEAYVKALGNQLEARMDYLAKKSPFLSTTMVAVTAALEAYDESKKKSAEIDRLRLELKRAQEEKLLAKLDADRANEKAKLYAEELGIEED